MLRLVGGTTRPVDLIRTLRAAGLSLRTAHQTVTRLAEETRVAVLLPDTSDWTALRRDLAGFGVELERQPVPDRVDTRAVRIALGLTQAEFAARFGLSLDSIQNWEQGRSQPDGPAQTLLTVIARDPAAVERALAG